MGRPDFTITFMGGGGGKEKSQLSHTKRRGGKQFFFPLHCGAENRKARSEEVGGHTAEDQKQIYLQAGIFFREKQESRRTVKGEKKRTSGTE